MEKPLERLIPIKSNKVLCVEGKDELNFFDKLTSYLKLTGTQVIEVGGNENFGPTLKALSASEGFRNLDRIGFIRDAEQTPATSKLESLKRCCKEVGLPIPESPGEILKNQRPWIGAFIMPDNEKPGMIEDLCIKSIERQEEYGCIDKFFECVKHGLQKQGDFFDKPNKRRVQIYLATKVPLVNSLGLGAMKDHWNFENESFSSIKQFVSELFE